MRSFGFRLMVLVAILVAGIGPDARALGHRNYAVETVYVMPSSMVLPVPTSYVVSTSFVEPTVYAVPTYYTTAYWMDPVVLAQPTYATTAYVRRGLFGRNRIVERPVTATYATSYVSTAYYAPTTIYRPSALTVVDPMVVPSAYVATSACCPQAVASAAPTYASPSRGAGGASSGSRAVRSEAENRASMESNVEPPPEQLEPANRGGAGMTPPNNLPDYPESARDNTPPTPPAPAAPRPSSGGNLPGGGAATNPTPPAGGNAGAVSPAPAGGGAVGNPSNVAPPSAPGGPAESDLGNPPAITPQGTNRRDSMKPSYYTRRPVPTARNVLMGTVVSRTAGEPEEGVPIRVRNASTGADRSITSDAFGRFAVRLADGDWSVDVTMPSGRVYEVSRLRVSDGQIVDNLGRRIPTLEITR